MGVTAEDKIDVLLGCLREEVRAVTKQYARDAAWCLTGSRVHERKRPVRTSDVIHAEKIECTTAFFDNRMIVPQKPDATLINFSCDAFRVRCKEIVVSHDPIHATGGMKGTERFCEGIYLLGLTIHKISRNHEEVGSK